MTRPMPGPPEKYQVLRRYVLVWRGGVEHYQHSSEIDAKRLTDAECAAEYWRAATVSERARAAQAITRDPGDYLSVAKGFLAASREQITWHRFATRPHALEES